METCCPSLVITETEIKATVRCLLTPIRAFMLKKKKPHSKGVKKLEASSCWREGTLVQPVGTARRSTKTTQNPRMISNSNSGIFPEELKAEMQRDICTSTFAAAPPTTAKEATVSRSPLCPRHNAVLFSFRASRIPTHVQRGGTVKTLCSVK